MVTKQLTLRPGARSSKHRPNAPIPNSPQELRVQVRRLEVGGLSTSQSGQTRPISARQSVTLKNVVIVRSSPQKCLKHFRFRIVLGSFAQIFSYECVFFWCFFSDEYHEMHHHFGRFFFFLKLFPSFLKGRRKSKVFSR